MGDSKTVEDWITGMAKRRLAEGIIWRCSAATAGVVGSVPNPRNRDTDWAMHFPRSTVRKLML